MHERSTQRAQDVHDTDALQQTLDREGGGRGDE